MSGSIKCAVVGVAVVALAGVLVGGGAAVAVQGPAYTSVAGSSVPLASRAAVTGSVPGTTRLSVQVWLKPDIAAAETLATSVSTPGNTQHGHYLSPAAYTAAYGPSPSAATAVASWLRTEGFTGISDGPGRAYVRATAPVSVIESAFRTSLNLYQSSAGGSGGSRPLRANSSPVSVPSSLSGSVIGVTGLDNAPAVPLEPTVGHAAATAPGKAASPACSSYYGQHLAAGLPKMFGATSFPSQMCGYHASQLRAAYGANGVNTGRSQTIALVELGLAPGMYRSLQVYAAAMKLPAPSKTRYQELAVGKNTDCADWADEEQLDVEASYAMAPSAHQLVVGGGSCAADESGLQGLDDADVAVLNGSGSRPLATIVSNSWGNPLGETQSAQLTTIQHAFLAQAAAEGVGMYFASGDASGVEPPASDPFAITVGATTLGLGKANNRLFETGWSTDGYVLSQNGKSWTEQKEMGAASGGASLVWAQPAYQAGVVPSALAMPPGDRGLARAVPDISADGDPLTGIDVYGLNPDFGTYSWGSSGGTSLAAPLVAGIVADAQQGQAQPFGFLNPALYQLAGSTALRDVLPLNGTTPAAYRGVWCEPEECVESESQPGLGVFDVQSSTMNGYTEQVTLSGYDTMTGLGTPNGQAFIAGLRALQG